MCRLNLFDIFLMLSAPLLLLPCDHPGIRKLAPIRVMRSFDV